MILSAEDAREPEMRALRGAISLQTPGHHRPARSLAVCHLLGCSRIRPLRCFAQMSLNRHLTEVCWIQHTWVRPTCGGCPFMDVWWLGSWNPSLVPRTWCQRLDPPLLHHRFSCSQTCSIFQTSLPDLTFASAIFPGWPLSSINPPPKCLCPLPLPHLS